MEAQRPYVPGAPKQNIAFIHGNSGYVLQVIILIVEEQEFFVLFIGHSRNIKVEWTVINVLFFVFLVWIEHLIIFLLFLSKLIFWLESNQNISSIIDGEVNVNNFKVWEFVQVIIPELESRSLSIATHFLLKICIDPFHNVDVLFEMQAVYIHLNQSYDLAWLTFGEKHIFPILWNDTRLTVGIA